MESGPRPVGKKPFYKRWWFRIIAFLALLYMVGVLLLIKDWYQTPAAVERIHARKVTMEMVEGKKLPPYPPIDRMNDTVAGYDVNENGVRDDVEIEIHRRHADSPKIRAAQLQYAMALQTYFTDVFSEKTLDAAIFEWLRAGDCLDSLHESGDLSFLHSKPVEAWTREDMDRGNAISSEHHRIIKEYTDQVESLVFNSERRKEKHEKIVHDFSGTGVYDYEKNPSCDIGPEQSDERP